MFLLSCWGTPISSPKSKDSIQKDLQQYTGSVQTLCCALPDTATYSVADSVALLNKKQDGIISICVVRDDSEALR